MDKNIAGLSIIVKSVEHLLGRKDGPCDNSGGEGIIGVKGPTLVSCSIDPPSVPGGHNGIQEGRVGAWAWAVAGGIKKGG